MGAGSRILNVGLMGIGSTTMHAVDVLDGRHSTHRLALRRFTNAERLRDDPWYRPENEANALRCADIRDVPAPRLVAADSTASETDVPTLLISRLPGHSPSARPRDTEAFLSGLAGPLAVIHHARATDDPAMPHYEPYYSSADTKVPAWSDKKRDWERALEHLATMDAPIYAPVFIHRDYHHGNTLWSGDRLVGVVDWTTGCWGPRGIDLARARLNLASDFDIALAEAFVSRYVTAGGSGDARDPYWDLLDAVDLMHDLNPPQSAEDARAFDRFERYVAGVLSEI